MSGDSCRVQAWDGMGMDINLDGKVVLVTGASKGIGAAIVRGLAKTGAFVVAHYAQDAAGAEKLASEIGSDKCIAVQADLSQQEGSKELWSKALAWQGHIDVLVCNAALVERCSLDDGEEAWRSAWTAALSVNVSAVAELCGLAIKHFRGQGGGTIINMASRAAFRGDDAELMHYAASKGAIVALTRSIAKSYGKEKVLAYIVAPGFVRTERQEGVIKLRGEAVMTKDIPLGEMATPEDVANCVTFLASGLARHATGTTIDINGASYFH